MRYASRHSKGAPPNVEDLSALAGSFEAASRPLLAELPGFDTGVCVVGGTAVGMLTRVEVRAAEGLGSAPTWSLTTDVGDLDLAFRPAGTQGYSDLRRDATTAQLYDVTVHIASLADVIRSKQAANRPKDQRVLPTLREILATREQQR